jgi:hypothetical protein
VSTPEVLNVEGIRPLVITAMGHGSRQMCRMDKYGFPRTTTKKFKRVHGFQTGDMVKVIVPNGKKAGAYKRERKVSSGAKLDGKLFGLLATLISKLRVVLSRVLAIGTALCCIEAMVILTKGGRHSSPPDWNNQKGYPAEKR